MNAYYQNNDGFDSNKRIIEAYFGEKSLQANSLQKLLDSILYVLSLILQVLTSATAHRIARVGATVVTFVGFIGIIGAMECGSLGMGAGILIGIALIVIEILCLRPHRA